MCLRLDSRRISISMSFHALSFQGGNMNPPITMQYHLLPGGGGAQQPSRNNSSESAQCADENKNSNNNNNNNGAENAHADDKKSSNVNDNADHICWTCHKELVCLKKNICAGCFKVCHYILFFTQSSTECCRLGTVTRSVGAPTGRDTANIVFSCNRRSGRRERQKNSERILML